MHFTEEDGAIKPPSFVVVRPDAFKGTWDERPTSEVAIGLRLIAMDDLNAARGVAAEVASRAHPDVDPDDPVHYPLWVECFNDALMLWIVAHGVCDPNDIASPWKPFEAAPEDMARDYLTPGGVRFIYDHWERMRIATDPTAPEISDDELVELYDLIDDRLVHCGRARGARVRRLLAFVAEELRATAAPPPAP